MAEPETSRFLLKQWTNHLSRVMMRRKKADHQVALMFPSIPLVLENFQKGQKVELWFLTAKYQAYSANEIFPGNSQLIFQTQGWNEGD